MIQRGSVKVVVSSLGSGLACFKLVVVLGSSRVAVKLSGSVKSMIRFTVDLSGVGG
jgi:hypothetical protein